MKKRFVWIILLLVVVAAVVCVFVLKNAASRPGDLPDPKTVPKADTSSVGTTVTLSLEQQLKGQSNQYVTYAYISDPGRLVVFTGDVTDSTIMRMTVYELPETKLLDILNGEVEAKILGVANVSWYEWQLLNTCIYAARQETSASDSEVIDLAKSDLPTGDGTRFYFGYYAAMNSGGLEQEVAPGRFAFLFGNIAQNQSNNMANAIQNLKNTGKRFDLLDVLGI
jgi:hypothetical protein